MNLTLSFSLACIEKEQKTATVRRDIRFTLIGGPFWNFISEEVLTRLNSITINGKLDV